MWGLDQDTKKRDKISVRINFHQSVPVTEMDLSNHGGGRFT